MAKVKIKQRTFEEMFAFNKNVQHNIDNKAYNAGSRIKENHIVQIQNDTNALLIEILLELKQ